MQDPSIGAVIDAAMVAIEGCNPSLKRTLPKIYNSKRVDDQRLARLVRLMDRVTFQRTVG